MAFTDLCCLFLSREEEKINSKGIGIDFFFFQSLYQNWIPLVLTAVAEQVVGIGP
jgi:hypothetical protein